MIKRVICLNIVALAILLTTGCRSQQPEVEMIIQRAPIHDVNVRIAESYPPQVFVYIKGGLADSCTTFHELKTEGQENVINITVTTQRPKDAVCAQVYSYFEKNVALGSEFISGQAYLVKVNDRAATFVMQ